MRTEVTDSRHQLSGNWPATGAMNQVDSLSHSLHDLTAASKERIHIDCGCIDYIAMNGLQLLHVWMECVRIGGMEAQFLNLTDSMRQTIERLGLGHCFTDTHPNTAWNRAAL